MNLSDLEDAFYTYGELNYRIGRMETDGNSASKKYDKLVEERDYLRNKFPTYLLSCHSGSLSKE